jgi:hypothetical protein
MFRTRFRQQIVAEFLPPKRQGRKQRVIILCDGMPSIPRKQLLSEFLAVKGFWVIYPRYRGTWESDGQFLERSPHETSSESSPIFQRILKTLPSVGASIFRRMKSL